MKLYGGFEAKKKRGGIYLPPVGQYEAEIQGVRIDKSYSGDHDTVVCMVEITEGEHKGQYHKVFEDQKKRFGDVKYKGTFTIQIPNEGDEPWQFGKFESNLWCISDSNPGGDKWDWGQIAEHDFSFIKGKKVGINVRENTYVGKDGKERTTTEIGQFESINDIRNGECKDMKPRGQKKATDEPSASGSEFTGIEFGNDVTGQVEVPF